jgi:predicted adenylyl cyclase CyaB
MVEIELKAWVDDWDAVETALDSFMEYEGPVQKDDEVWSLPLIQPGPRSGDFRLRVRRQPEGTVVTVKDKSYRNGLEINREVEFGVSDPASFAKMLSMMSARRLYGKSKRGKSWRSIDGVLAELLKVEGLGDFLEVEILRDDGQEFDERKIKAELAAVLSRCGIPESRIESRTYSQMLGLTG